MLNCVTLWPVVLTLYWTEYEVLDWTCVPWQKLSAAAALSLGKRQTSHNIILILTSLSSHVMSHDMMSCDVFVTNHWNNIMSAVANMLANLSVMITYEHFITLGLVAAIPASALYDIQHNLLTFTDNGMKLTGILFICFGFILVLTPANLVSTLRRSLKWRRQVSQLPGSLSTKSDLRTGYIESRLRSPSGRVR